MTTHATIPQPLQHVLLRRPFPQKGPHGKFVQAAYDHLYLR